MYYSNINDDEVKMFHGVTAPNFTIKLTDILHKTGGSFDNKLFKIEEIVSDKVFKIYPMFNTNKITSSNSNDKIMDNRLIIAEKTTKETRISFISNDDEEVEDYVAYGTYKSIGDNLSTAEFNAIVQLLRNDHILTDSLHIKNGTLNGEYGEYIFDIDSTTIVDNGILITNETLTNLGTVTLTSPSFNNATYILYLTVYSYDDVNIMEDETTIDPTITTLEIELIKDTPVNIPFNTLTSSCIVSFDAHIDIKQDKPVITGAYVTGLNITTNKDTLTTDETSTLTITATDLGSLPVTGKTVKLYKDGTLLNTLTTDSNGEANYTYTGVADGKHTFTVTHLGTLTTTINIYDSLWYDPMTSDVSKWASNNTSLTASFSDDGTTLTNTTETTYNYTSTYTATDNVIIEFDMQATSETIGQVRFNYKGADRYMKSALTDGLQHHMKFDCNNGSVTWYVDDTVTGSSQTTTTATVTRFLINNASVKIKDFKIYPR